MLSQVIYIRMESIYACSTHSMLYFCTYNANKCQIKPLLLQVGTLAISMFYRKHYILPITNREGGEKVAKKLFNSQKNCINESNKKFPFQCTSICGHCLRGGAQRLPLFFGFYLSSSTFFNT